MSKKSHLRGHEIEMVGGEWVYSDTKEPTVDNWMKRPCGYCNLHFTNEGHDGCLGTLPGVMNACCGHGNSNDAYIQLLDGTCIFKNDAIKLMDILSKEKEENRVIAGYKVEYAWFKYPHDKLAIRKKYFKRKLHARAFFLKKIQREHYYCARIVPILKEGTDE